MSQRLKLSIAAAIGVLIGATALAVVTAMGDGDEVQIQARRHSDGRVEVALKDSAGARHLPEQRFLSPDAAEGQWHSSSPLSVAEAVDHDVVGQTATAVMRGPDGEEMGTVSFTQGPRGVLIQARISGLPAGAHAFHIHETGACSPEFTAAGGHYAPRGLGHGIHDEGGQHAGDQPNIIAHTDGWGLADYYTEAVTFDPALVHTMFDEDGTAIIIHQNPDSYTADPMAGGRLACGVVTLDSPGS